MSGDFDEFLSHTITVQTRTGEGGMGPQYAAPVVLSPANGNGVYVEEKRRLVLDVDAQQVISEATVIDMDASHSTLYAPGSVLSLPSGRSVRVLAVALRSAAESLDLPNHLEVSTT